MAKTKVSKAKKAPARKKVALAKKAAKKVAAAQKTPKQTSMSKTKRAIHKKSPSRTMKTQTMIKPLSLSESQQFVADLLLPKLPSKGLGLAEAKEIPLPSGVDQSLVVGSDIVSFTASLPSTQRSLIMNSLLLAQLAANHKVPDRKKVRNWYDVYFDTLASLQWLIQEKGFNKHKEQGTEFEVHKAILAVATTVFGAGATALAIISSTLNALQEMGDGPWLKLFNRESKEDKVARFQMTIAEPSTDGGSMISLMAFELNAKGTLTQILFFKFKTAKVTFSHASGKVTLDKVLGEKLALSIAKRVTDYYDSFIENIPLYNVRP